MLSDVPAIEDTPPPPKDRMEHRTLTVWHHLKLLSRSEALGVSDLMPSRDQQEEGEETHSEGRAFSKHGDP